MIEQAIVGAHSLTEAIKNLGLSGKGDNFKAFRRRCKKFNIDISDLESGKYVQRYKPPKYSLEDILKEGVNFNSWALKNRLIEEGIKEDKCELCGQGNEWNGMPLSLQLHHINGKHDDNRLDNLQILCPNCHTQTETFCKRKSEKEVLAKPLRIKRNEERHKAICPQCGKEFLQYRNLRHQKFCSKACYTEFTRTYGNTDDSIKKPIEDSLREAMPKAVSMTDLAKILGWARTTTKARLADTGLYEEFKAQLAAKGLSGREKTGIPVIQMDKDGNTIAEYSSIKEASAATGAAESSIRNCCKGMPKYKTALGFKWRYADSVL